MVNVELLEIFGTGLADDGEVGNFAGLPVGGKVVESIDPFVPGLLVPTLQKKLANVTTTRGGNPYLQSEDEAILKLQFEDSIFWSSR